MYIALEVSEFFESVLLVDSEKQQLFYMYTGELATSLFGFF